MYLYTEYDCLIRSLSSATDKYKGTTLAGATPRGSTPELRLPQSVLQQHPPPHPAPTLQTFRSLWIVV
jgi:hypothetical protein